VCYNRIYEEKSMTKIDAIKKAIDALPEDDYAQLRRWFSENGWRTWDRGIKADSASGKLDFLISEALDEKNKGKLRNL
jgi:hypothetical protein